jgi:hypothetical protein
MKLAALAPIVATVALSLCSCNKDATHTTEGSSMTRLDDTGLWADYYQLDGHPMFLVYMKEALPTPSGPHRNGITTLRGGVISVYEVINLGQDLALTLWHSSDEPEVISINGSQHALKDGRVFLAGVRGGKISIMQLDLNLLQLASLPIDDSTAKHEALRSIPAREERIRDFFARKPQEQGGQ